MMRHLDMVNRQEDNVKLIFMPCYLTGDDGIVELSYYDTVLGNDLCVFPSYYEPWGYTPLEAVAFHVPCITTDLAGFGLWANNAMTPKEVRACRSKADKLSKKALWSEFIPYYEEAYDLALRKAEKRAE